MIYEYESLIELRAAWESYERRGGGGGGTTVLVLDPNFGGDLPSLIRRRQPQSRHGEMFPGRLGSSVGSVS